VFLYLARPRLHQITCPAWTWVFNLNNGKWHQRQSYLLTNSRITQTCYAFGKWLCGDSQTGNVQQITSSVKLEIANPLICEVWSAPLHDFPQRARGGRHSLILRWALAMRRGQNRSRPIPALRFPIRPMAGRRSRFRAFAIGRAVARQNPRRVNQIKACGAQGYIWKVRMSDPRISV
jgi:hypothetical protein